MKTFISNNYLKIFSVLIIIFGMIIDYSIAVNRSTHPTTYTTPLDETIKLKAVILFVIESEDFELSHHVAHLSDNSNSFVFKNAYYLLRKYINDNSALIRKTYNQRIFESEEHYLLIPSDQSSQGALVFQFKVFSSLYNEDLHAGLYKLLNDIHDNKEFIDEFHNLISWYFIKSDIDEKILNHFDKTENNFFTKDNYRFLIEYSQIEKQPTVITNIHNKNYVFIKFMPLFTFLSLFIVFFILTTFAISKIIKKRNFE